MTTRTPVEQRVLARKLRAEVRAYKSVTEATTIHEVSRAHYYRLVNDLEAWETQSTREEEIAELAAQFGHVKYFPLMWDMVSGQRLLNYIQGLDNILENIDLGAKEDLLS